MKKLFPVLSVFCAIMVLCVNCPIDRPENYDIGDIGPSGVGIVFYITDGGLHGLEAAPVDQSTSQVWIEGGSTQTTENGNTSWGGGDIGVGLGNSNAIIAQPGHTGSAAKVCRDYTGGGKTDWFLPSIVEWNELYPQREVVGGFELTSLYWSSDEFNSNNALYLELSSYDGINIPAGGKSMALRVRAVRVF